MPARCDLVWADTHQRNETDAERSLSLAILEEGMKRHIKRHLYVPARCVVRARWRDLTEKQGRVSD